MNNQQHKAGFKELFELFLEPAEAAEVLLQAGPLASLFAEDDLVVNEVEQGVGVLERAPDLGDVGPGR